MPFGMVTSLIAGTKNFAENCEILYKVCSKKKSFKQHFPIFDKSRFFSVCVFNILVVIFNFGKYLFLYSI